MDVTIASENTQEQKLMESAPVNNNTNQPQELDTIMKIAIFIGNLCTYSILGFVLYLVWKDTRPKDSKTVGKLSLIALGIDTLLILCYFILLFVIFGSIASFSAGALLATPVPNY